MLESPIVVATLILVFSYVLGVLSGYQEHRQGKKITWQIPALRRSAQTFVVGLWTGLVSGITVSVGCNVAYFIIGCFLTWALPLLHIPAPYDLPTTLGEPEEAIAVGIFMMYFGMWTGTSVGVQDDLAGKRNLLKSGIFAAFPWLLACVGVPLMAGLTFSGFYILLNSTCNRNPWIHGGTAWGLIVTIIVLYEKLRQRYALGSSLFTDNPHMVTEALFFILTLFSFIVVLLTIIAC